MMNWFKVVTLCSTLSIFSAFALTVEEGKTHGIVGETLSGYLAVIEQSSADAKQLVEHINAERKNRYTEIADKNGLKTNDVARMAGQKLVERAPAGEYVRGINGQWMQKK
ncbi:TPA: YdbL family protein [Providencia alcalifaciens]